MHTPKRARPQGNEAIHLTPARKTAKASVSLGEHQQQFQTPKKTTSEAQYRHQLTPKTPLPHLQNRTGKPFTATLV